MMRVSEAARVLAADARGADVAFTGVSTDTRSIRPGDLFVALRGERFDGHAFLREAQASGAAAALVDQAATVSSSLPVIVVSDTRRALGELAAHWRSRFDIPVVALTGSSGKTTVKEMLAAILRETCGDEAVLATRGNLNNDIGVPLMLLELGAKHRYAVIEMGMNHEGEIRYLSQLAQPDVALVNNAGRAHIEFLGSEERIARAKGEIFEGLGANGTAVINADDRFADLWREIAGDRKRVEFALDHAADVTATYELRPLETNAVISTSRGTAKALLKAPGVHNVRNALAAAAAAVALDVSMQVLGAGLERFSGIKGRLQMKAASNGTRIIDDTYNANPESMRAAIDVLSGVSGPRILVVGDMGELGSHSPRLHAELGTYAKSAGIDSLFTLGEQARRIAEAFGPRATHCASIEELIESLERVVTPQTTLLVKGSRFMRMERVVAALVDERSAACS